MSLDFTETLTIEIPDVEEQVDAFKESAYQKTHGLIIEVAAIHEGMTANFNFYPAEALKDSLESWVSPYPKPIIMNHDPSSEPVGRVMAAKMAEEDDGTPYVLLQVAITDPEAISKVVDQRYLTGSVGGSAKQANCSVCGADWAEASLRNIPCKHSRGKTYKGKLCYMEMNGIGFKEYSFVNMPADQRSSIRALRTQEGEAGDDGWTRAARVFSLNMDDEEILEFSESASSVNLLENKKKKDATPIYMQLKGAFLSAMAVSESEKDERNDEELDVNKDIINEEEEDILAVTEGLSSDLAESEEEEETVEETEASAEEDKEEESVEEDETEEASTEEAEEDESEISEEAVASEEEVEEGDTKPEGQESPKSKDVDPDDSSGAPVSREDDDEEEIVAEDEQVEEEEEEVNEEEGTETDLNEAVSALESRVEELETREQTLLEENAKLKAALKRNLAERVVDMKVALGLVEADDRESELEEHTKRSASSLADSLRDLAGMSRIQNPDLKPPQINNESASIEENDNSIIVDTDVEEEEDNEPDPEDVFVDALMGRRKL